VLVLEVGFVGKDEERAGLEDDWGWGGVGGCDGGDVGRDGGGEGGGGSWRRVKVENGRPEKGDGARCWIEGRSVGMGLRTEQKMG
jgi:hypothetical protein